MIFTGGTKINHECDSIISDSTWIAFSGEIDPDDIYVPIPQLPKDKNGNDIFASTLMVDSDSIFLYSTFLTPSLNDNENNIFYADGYLTYDKEKGVYKVSKQEKLAEPNFPANLMSLQTSFCFIHTEGDFDLGLDLGQVKLKSVGEMNNDMSKSDFRFDLMMGVDFFVDEKNLDFMAKTINDEAKLKKTDMTDEDYIYKLSEYIGWKGKNKMVNAIVLNGEKTKVPEEMQQSIVFSEIKFVWNTETHSYKSVGKLGIANIGKTPINKYVKGSVEIIKKNRMGSKTSRDQINIYISPKRGKWFFFSYDTEIMRMVSSMSDFNTLITELDNKKRKQKVIKGEPNYSYYPATIDDKTEFLESFFSEEAPPEEEEEEILEPEEEEKPEEEILEPEEVEEEKPEKEILEPEEEKKPEEEKPEKEEDK